MEVIYGLIPAVILVGLIAVGVLFWAARSGQFDDLDGEASRILMDDNDEPGSKQKSLTESDGSLDPGGGDATDGTEKNRIR